MTSINLTSCNNIVQLSVLITCIWFPTYEYLFSINLISYRPEAFRSVDHLLPVFFQFRDARVWLEIVHLLPNVLDIQSASVCLDHQSTIQQEVYINHHNQFSFTYRIQGCMLKCIWQSSFTYRLKGCTLKCIWKFAFTCTIQGVCQNTLISLHLHVHRE